MNEIKLNGSEQLESQMEELCGLTDIFLQLEYPDYTHSPTTYTLVFPQGKGYNQLFIAAFLEVSRGFYSFGIELNNEAIVNTVSFILFLQKELEKATYVDFSTKEENFMYVKSE